MKKIVYTEETMRQMLDEVQKGHKAFLLTAPVVTAEVNRFQKNFGNLPKRLQNALIYITSGEKLPNSYQAFTVYNTQVTLLVKNGEVRIDIVERNSVYKNSDTTNRITFRNDVKDEVKDILFKQFI